MNEPFVATEIDSETGWVTKEMAQGFDFESVYSSIDGDDEPDDVDLARREGAERMLRQIVFACVGNLESMRKSRKAAAIGVRLVAIAHNLIGQAGGADTVTRIALELGIDRTSFWRAGKVSEKLLKK